MRDFSHLKAGVVGTGFMGPVHIEALRRIGIEVLALAEQNDELAGANAKELGVPRAYGTFEGILNDPDISVLHIAAPNHLHFPYTKASLEKGKHVICEKPLTLNSRESEELLALSGKSATAAAVNYNLRFYPMVVQAREYVRNGRIGDIFLVHGTYLQDWLLFDTDWNWRLDPKAGGELRVVSDLGSHWLDMITFITGTPIVSVCADFTVVHAVRQKPTGNVATFGEQSSNEMGTSPVSMSTEDAASILFRFADGHSGSLVVSQVSAGHKNRLDFEINGSRSSLGWNSEEPNSLWIGERNAANQLLMKDPSLLSPGVRGMSSFPGGHQEGYPDTLKQMFRCFYQAVADGSWKTNPPYPTIYDGHQEMLLCDALLESAKKRCWVDIPGKSITVENAG